MAAAWPVAFAARASRHVASRCPGVEANTRLRRRDVSPTLKTRRKVQLPSSRDFTNQVGGLDLESFGEIQHDGQCRNVLATFDETNVADAQLGAFREHFLGQAALRSKFSDQRTEHLAIPGALVSSRHPCIMTMVGLYCRTTMVVI